MTIYQQLPDKSIILKVNTLFYDLVYAHPWLSLYFQDTKKEFIVSQQTDFMIGALGGPQKFSGRFPSNAHPHLFITDELFDLREELLKQALEQARAPQALVDKWLKIDESFRKVIVKSDLSECFGRWTTDPVQNFPNPHKKVA